MAQAGWRRGSADGYTLVEIQMVIGIAALVAGMTVLGIQSALPNVVSNAALDQLVGAMRIARAAAVSQRRPVEIRVTPPNRIDLVRIDPDATETTVSTVILESNPSFMLTTGLPDTPDGFGNATAVDFGSATAVRFLADGTLADENSVPISGSIFLGSTVSPLAARAVTLVGATGHATPWRWTGSRWEER